MHHENDPTIYHETLLKSGNANGTIIRQRNGASAGDVTQLILYHTSRIAIGEFVKISSDKVGSGNGYRTKILREKPKGSLLKGSFDKCVRINLLVLLPVPTPSPHLSPPPSLLPQLPQENNLHHPPEPLKPLQQGHQQELAW